MSCIIWITILWSIWYGRTWHPFLSLLFSPSPYRRVVRSAETGRVFHSASAFLSVTAQPLFSLPSGFCLCVPYPSGQKEKKGKEIVSEMDWNVMKWHEKK